MADELDEEERELLAKHRAKKAKARPGRKVTVRGKHDSGAEYSFDLDGDEAERVISRHRALWADDDPPEEDTEDEEGGDGGEAEEGDEGGPGGGGKRAAGGSAAEGKPSRRGPYFRK